MSALDNYSDDCDPPTVRTCDCGRPKNSCARACPRCRFMDGNQPETADLISILRGTDGLSVTEAAEMLRKTRDTVHGSMQSLYRSGRARRYWREAETTSGTQHGRYGGTKKYASSNGGHWVYALNGRGE